VIGLVVAAAYALSAGTAERKGAAATARAASAVTAPPPAAWCAGLRAYRGLDPLGLGSKTPTYLEVTRITEAIDRSWRKAAAVSGDTRYRAAAGHADQLSRTTGTFVSVVDNATTLTHRIVEAVRAIDADVAALPVC
jgi:hypothetical protein